MIRSTIRKTRLAGFVIIFLLALKGSLVFSQGTVSLNIDSCYAFAKLNYPMVKQWALLEQARDYSINNVSKGYWPQLSISGQASYQSDVTRLPSPIAESGQPVISKDQYKIYGDINQSLTDIIVIRNQKDLIKANSAAEEQKVEVELYKLKERINQLFFGILLLDAQLQQTELLKIDLKAGISKTTAAISNGTALKSNLEVLQAEMLKSDQRTIELKASRKGYTDMLALFINKPVDASTKFETPATKNVSSDIHRPELRLFEIQKKSLDVQNQLINSKNLPRLGLFLQGGYGRPALNFLNDQFDFYYIGGVRLYWNVAGLYTIKKEKQLVRINQSSLDVQQEVFLFNTNYTLKQQNSELDKLLQLIATDNAIISLREGIKLTANNQLENGTITANDFIIYLNAEDQARQNLLLHQVQLIFAQYNYQTTSGN